MPSRRQEVIDAVAYVRKSTKGEKSTQTGEGTRRRERQEKSIEQQREEILKHAKGRFRIIRWYEDAGVSGWKREADRPGFARILADARVLHDFRAIVCDDADRFSRASYRKAIRDVDDLAEAGVEVISSVSQGDFRIDDETDAGEAHRLIAAAMASHEYSRKLSRRVTLARRNAAEEGKHTGGPFPYGLESDGNGGLKHGDETKLNIIRWLFDQLVNHLRSLNWLAGDLNRRKVSPPAGKAWYPKTIALLLRQSNYRGDFHFNTQHRGQFYGIDAEGEVVESSRLDGPGRAYRCEGAYTPVVDPELFDRAQERLDLLAGNPGRRKRVGYALTGVLVCGHCGLPMYGVQVKRKSGRRSPTVYRCNGNSRYGQGQCGQYQIREEVILPFVLRLLGEEITDIQKLLTNPPEEGTPWAAEEERLAKLTQDRQELAAQIETAEGNLLFVRDARTRDSLDAKVSALRDRLDTLDAELTAARQAPKASRESAEALTAWWDEFNAAAVRVPVRDDQQLASHGIDTSDWTPEAIEEAEAVLIQSHVLADPHKVNEALHQLGCQVSLTWKVEEYTSMRYKDKQGNLLGGNLKKAYVPTGGRFRLGQREGKIKRQDLDTTACPRGSRPCRARRAARRSRPAGRRSIHSIDGRAV
jgi:site-specific DNA recombinase